PLAALEEEHRRGVAKVTDGGQPFHVAALDGLELDGDRDEGGDLSGLAVAGKLHLRRELTVAPAQAARFTGGRGGVEELRFQPLPLEPKEFACPFEMYLAPERP